MKHSLCFCFHLHTFVFVSYYPHLVSSIPSPFSPSPFLVSFLSLFSTGVFTLARTAVSNSSRSPSPPPLPIPIPIPTPTSTALSPTSDKQDILNTENPSKNNTLVNSTQPQTQEAMEKEEERVKKRNHSESVSSRARSLAEPPTAAGAAAAFARRERRASSSARGTPEPDIDDVHGERHARRSWFLGCFN